MKAWLRDIALVCLIAGGMYLMASAPLLYALAMGEG